VLILDEATSSLDATSQQTLLERVARFRDEGGTVMMITHKADNAAMADRTIKI
jgi:ABC-type multidrug transport system ATPase subunit